MINLKNYTGKLISVVTSEREYNIGLYKCTPKNYYRGFILLK